MSNKKETIQQIIGLLSSLIEDDAPEAEPTPKAKATKRRRSKSKTTSNSTNKFDTMDARHLHKEDTAIDKILSVKPPCPRTRQYSTIDVACRSCGKRETVNPVLVTEASRYKCNDCARSGG